MWCHSLSRVCVCVCVCVPQCVCVCVCLSLSLSVCVWSVWVCMCLSFSLGVCLCMCFCVCVYLSLCLCVCVCVCMCVFVFVCVLVSLSMWCVVCENFEMRFRSSVIYSSAISSLPCDKILFMLLFQTRGHSGSAEQRDDVTVCLSMLSNAFCLIFNLWQNVIVFS